jgi:hypothetical protein
MRPADRPSPAREPLVELPDGVGADLTGRGQDPKEIPPRRWSERASEESRILAKHRARANQWCANVRDCRLSRRPHSLSRPSPQPISGIWISGRSRRPLPRPKQPTINSLALRVARHYGRARCCVRSAIRTSGSRRRTRLSPPRGGTFSRSGVRRDQTRRQPTGDWPGSRSSLR